ncbi:hypothetical protein [Pseudoxanthomonas sp.]|jgi:hypothetical protein|uniref:hypothetical protein n=1 Tax=Pseudoxanthomonas sp. TaxID=1871049 RepID=UPI002FE16002
MAENEFLDFGHATRWRASRNVLKDPASTVHDLVETADADCEKAVRKLSAALRKAPPFLNLMRALSGSVMEQQEAISAFTEKRLATVVMDVAKCNPRATELALAQAAAVRMLDIMADQITTRSLREGRFCSPIEQTEMREGLASKFAKHVPMLATMIGASLVGETIRRARLPKAPPRPRAQDMVHRSLLGIARPEQPRAH